MIATRTWTETEIQISFNSHQNRNVVTVVNPHTSAEELVAHIWDQGLQITQLNIAARKIDEIGHERLRICFLSRRDHTQPAKP